MRCAGCKGGWIGTGEPWEYDEARYRSLDEARTREQQAMLDYQATDGCRMAFLRANSTTPSSRPTNVRPMRQLHRCAVRADVDPTARRGHPRSG